MKEEIATTQPSKRSSRSQTSKSGALALRQVQAVAITRTVPSWAQWKKLFTVFSPGERASFVSSLGVFCLSLLWLGGWYVTTHREIVPTVGGSYTEAVVGEPQLINPLYAQANEADADLTALVYSGLMKWDARSGLVPDVAESIFISEDGKTYTFRLKKEAVFHDGEPLRVRDVQFTIQAIQDPLYRSPLAPLFHGIETTQVDDTTISFTLKQPSTPFLSALTVGILPAHVWEDIPAKNATLAAPNMEPIGSGPFRFSQFEKDKRGSIRSFTLERFTDYYADGPLLQTLTFKFYTDAEAAMQALESKHVEGASFVPDTWHEVVEKNKQVQILKPDTHKQTALYFNEAADEWLKKPEIRRAIALAINKQAIVADVLRGEHALIDDPLLPMALPGEPLPALTRNVEEAKQLITSVYKSEELLTFTLTTAQTPELVAVAEAIAKDLAEAGITLRIETVDPASFFSQAALPRKFEILLATTSLGYSSDPFPLWHSAQAKEGGLNLSGYAKRNVDGWIERMRISTKPEERATAALDLVKEIRKDVPAVFLYRSRYRYAVSSKMSNVSMSTLAKPADRFSTVAEWYTHTKSELR